MNMSTEQDIAPKDAFNDLQDTQKAEWLSFKLGDLDYAVDILKVREIRTWEQCTRIPYAQDYVTGLINLRGAIVPIVNLRTRLGMTAKAHDAETVILIMDVELSEGHKTIGIVVDAISEVIETDSNNSQFHPEFDLSIDKRFVAGIADDNSNMLILLNIDTLLDLELSQTNN
ncbi:chemotaxis protein CheW [Alteromonas sp. a30]|uniref:chemotaxis protein CheW n=1 Tax=Alteromonas sp. a30 TaxID=2730917 RepID=UPI00227F6F98|nr:chemotaxis protein CheW [Alteromonas sp. a30]MCY7295372.1 purine-binding chemotaxis protein CheW [Alteromonas sp. a30]